MTVPSGSHGGVTVLHSDQGLPATPEWKVHPSCLPSPASLNDSHQSPAGPPAGTLWTVLSFSSPPALVGFATVLFVMGAMELGGTHDFSQKFSAKTEMSEN